MSASLNPGGHQVGSQADRRAGINETSPLHTGVGASSVVALGELAVLATLDQTHGASWEIGGVFTPFAAWLVMALALRPKWPSLLGSLAVAALYAVLGYVSAANFIFLGFAFPPAMLAVVAGWSNLMPLRSLALRTLGLAIIAFVAVAFMLYLPLPWALALCAAPWISSRAPRATLIVNRCASLVLATGLCIVGGFSTQAAVGGTAGLFALVAGIAISRPQEGANEDLPLKRPRLFVK